MTVTSIRPRAGAGILVASIVAFSLAAAGFLSAVIAYFTTQQDNVVGLSVLAVVLGNLLAVIVVVLGIIHLARRGRRTTGGIAIAVSLLALIGTVVGILALAIFASAMLLSGVAVFVTMVSGWILGAIFFG